MSYWVVIMSLYIISTFPGSLVKYHRTVKKNTWPKTPRHFQQISTRLPETWLPWFLCSAPLESITVEWSFRGCSTVWRLWLGVFGQEQLDNYISRLDQLVRCCDLYSDSSPWCWPNSIDSLPTRPCLPILPLCPLRTSHSLHRSSVAPHAAVDGWGGSWWIRVLWVVNFSSSDREPLGHAGSTYEFQNYLTGWCWNDASGDLMKRDAITNIKIII